MRKLRVLLLMHELSASGAPKVAAQAMEQLRNEVEVRTISLHGGDLSERYHALGPVQVLISQDWPGIQASPGQMLRFGWHRFLSILRARAWAPALRRWQPDVIYVNSVTSLALARRLRLPPAPVLLHVHELDSVLSYFAENLPSLLRDLPSRYVAVSHAVAEALTERYGVLPEKVVIVPAFVDAPEDYKPGPPPEDSRLIVGGAGLINWCKGPQLWLLTAFEVKRRLGAARVRFVWVGVPGSQEGWQFREMARKLDLTDDIEFVPFTSCPRDQYARFDIFALTSWEETASLVAMENMLLEKPVVCFAGTGGPREFVGDAGVVLPDFSPPQMAAAIAELAEDPARRAALGAAARRRVLENFTAAQQVPKLLAEMRRLAPGVN